MAKVIVFDSGVGGLSIAQAIYATNLNHQLIFASDNAAYPYGTKSNLELIPRVTQVVSRLVEETQADILVVACNTASTVALPELRNLLDIEVVGVVPAIKPAAKLSRNGSIGVLATPATIQRRYTKDLIERFAPDCQIILMGSSDLVAIAEKKLHQGQLDADELELIVQDWLKPECMIDTIVLACTHFPLLTKELDRIFKAHDKHIHWVDSATGIANRVGFLSSKLPASQQENANENNLAIFTREEAFSSHFKRVLNQIEIKETQFITME